MTNLVRAWATAYVQGDWTASPVSGSEDENISLKYTAMRDLIQGEGVANMATWHVQADGVVHSDYTKNKRADVMRNCREIDQADMVITYLQREDPPKKHWGSIALMMYAVGKGKPVILVAPENCIVWKHHAVHHPLITRLPVIDHAQALLLVRNTLCGNLPPTASWLARQ